MVAIQLSRQLTAIELSAAEGRQPVSNLPYSPITRGKSLLAWGFSFVIRASTTARLLASSHRFSVTSQLRGIVEAIPTNRRAGDLNREGGWYFEISTVKRGRAASVRASFAFFDSATSSVSSRPRSLQRPELAVDGSRV